MKKKKGIIISIIIVIVLVFCLIAYFVDKSRVQNNKEPIFSYNQSGGSVILYYGPGYVIVNDGKHGDSVELKYTKFDTWIGYIIEVIKEDISVRENNVTTFSKDEGVSVLKMAENTDEVDEELIRQIEEIYGKGTGEAFWVEYSDVTVENEHFIRVYGIDYEGESVWEYQTQKEDLGKEFYSIEYLGDEILNEQGTIKRLDLKTGSVLWTYSDYNGSGTLYAKEDQPLFYSYIDYCLYSKSSNKLFIMRDDKLIDMYDLNQYIKEHEFSEDYIDVIMHEQHVYLTYGGLNKERTKLLKINYDIDIENKTIDTNKEEYNYNEEL